MYVCLRRKRDDVLINILKVAAAGVEPLTTLASDFGRRFVQSGVHKQRRRLMKFSDSCQFMPKF